jgi:hypothetical protein
MKVTLVLAALLGFGTPGAVAQNAPRDPSGNQTIPQKDLSSRRGRNPKEQAACNSSLERFLKPGAPIGSASIFTKNRKARRAHEACRSGPIPTGRHAPPAVYTKSYFAGILFNSPLWTVTC